MSNGTDAVKNYYSIWSIIDRAIFFESKYEAGIILYNLSKNREKDYVV